MPSAERSLPKKVLVTDDDASIQALLKRFLTTKGYDVLAAYNGDEAIDIALRERPDIILLDLTLPGKSGEAVLKELRSHVNTKLIPVIFATGKGSDDDIIRGLTAGADDYISKPFPMEQLFARIESVLRRCAVNLDANPLSRLPGNGMIEREIQRLIDEKKMFDLLYVDLNHFKAFNDYYGFHRGDAVIMATADLLRNIAAQNRSMAAHIGGDDFVLITEGGFVHDIHAQIVEGFARLRNGFYVAADLAAGFISVTDRQNVERKFALLTLAVGVVSNRIRPIRSVGEVATISAEVKAVAKRSDTGFFIDRRVAAYDAPQQRRPLGEAF